MPRLLRVHKYYSDGYTTIQYYNEDGSPGAFTHNDIITPELIYSAFMETSPTEENEEDEYKDMPPLEMVPQ